MRQIRLFIWSIIFVSCSNPDKGDNSTFLYDYEIIKYYGDTLDSKNIREVDYYDSTKKIIRTVGTEIGCTRYLYDNQGKLKEKIWSRNCSGGRREIMIYDSSQNLIGTYVTSEALINIDTIQFQQSFFYDNKNRLIKELKSEHKDMEGNKFKIWHNYIYDQEKIINEIITENSNPLWICKYEYNDINQLTAIYRTRGQIFMNDFFKYNDKGLLVEKEVKGNEYPIGPQVAFTVSNNKTIYKYDISGNLTEEVLLSHTGKVHVKEIWTKKK